ncbi:MAG: Crp/Fnr family transcriptional regulator [Bacteroidetes bacterium]|nr:Crp/Fnr family transcriptional regulator [Bacteroidota bacterium]
MARVKKELDFSLILAALSRHVDLNTEEQACFCAYLSHRSLKNKELLQREGEVADSTFFVTRGCLRSYSTDEQGLEHVLQFAPPGWWIAELYSVISKRPGTTNIDALEASEVLVMKRSDQEKLFIELPKIERYFRIITENSLVSSRQRIIDSMTLSALERYQAFCKRYPGLIFSLPQKQIASYIGVTPEFFSKMKARF